REPDGEDVRSLDAERGGRIGPADEDRLAGPARNRPVGDAGDPQVDDLALADGERERRADRQSGSLGDAPGQDGDPAVVEALERGRPVTVDEVQPAICEEIR